MAFGGKPHKPLLETLPAVKKVLEVPKDVRMKSHQIPHAMHWHLQVLICHETPGLTD